MAVALTAVISIVIAVPIGMAISTWIHRRIFLELADSLSAARKILSRGNVNATFEVLERLENMIRKWERPRIED